MARILEILAIFFTIGARDEFSAWWLSVLTTTPSLV